MIIKLQAEKLVPKDWAPKVAVMATNSDVAPEQLA